MSSPALLAALRPNQPPLPLPEGFSREQILAALESFAIDKSPSGELEMYAREDCDRFLYTLGLISGDPQSALEIGSNPYFLTWLIRSFRPNVSLSLINYFGGDLSSATQEISLLGPNGVEERFTATYSNCNIEKHDIPFEDATFDTILFCEVLEHFIEDPLNAILNLKSRLKPGGKLILTTPNVARLENVARMVAGANIYDPYSGYGPYGRHNREYNRHELHRLMEYAGFEVDVLFTADVHHNRAGDFADLSRLYSVVHHRKDDLGQYIFSRWFNTGAAPERKPAWLYRSLPPHILDESAS